MSRVSGRERGEGNDAMTTETIRKQPWWSEWTVDYDEAELGDWRIDVVTVEPEMARFESLRAAINHHRPNRAVPEGTYRRLIHRERGIVMSDTPAEIRDCVEILWAVRDRRAESFVVNGLGLGIVPRWLLKNGATRIDVVEIDIEVIGLIGPQFFNDDRITIHHADALTMSWPTGTRWDFAWHDIWDAISMSNFPEMVNLHRKYGNRVSRQASWCREVVERKARRLGVRASDVARYERGG